MRHLIKKESIELVARHLLRSESTTRGSELVGCHTWCGEEIVMKKPQSQRVVTWNPKAATCEECLAEHGLSLLAKMGDTRKIGI